MVLIATCPVVPFLKKTASSLRVGMSYTEHPECPAQGDTEQVLLKYLVTELKVDWEDEFDVGKAGWLQGPSEF
jgi:hypothetical protein